jgi:hypothetical protein
MLVADKTHDIIRLNFNLAKIQLIKNLLLDAFMSIAMEISLVLMQNDDNKILLHLPWSSSIFLALNMDNKSEK